MRWSELKKKAEGLLCAAAVKRVQYFTTCYRDGHDNDGRAWIAIDGKDIFSACTRTFIRLQHEARYGKGNLSNYHTKVPLDTYENVRRRFDVNGIYEKCAFTGHLFTYVTSMDPQEALRSDLPLLRFFAAVDHRVGPRSIEKMEPKHLLDEHALAIRSKK